MLGSSERMTIGEYVTKGGAILSKELFRVSGTSISVFTLITLFFIVVFTFWLAKRLRKLTHQILSSRNPGAAASVSGLVNHTTLIIGFAVALSTAGINLSALFAAGAVFAVGLGFAMKSIVENFVAGIILLTERTIKPGDILEVEGIVVKVLDMGIRSSIVQSRDGHDIIIPNSILSQNSVKNFTLRDSFQRIRVSVGVEYSSDMKVVRDVLTETMAAISKSWNVPGRQGVVALRSFADSSVVWEVGCWTGTPWDSVRRESELLEAIWSALKDAEIRIAFPQLDVHLDASTESAIQIRGAA